MACYVLLSFSSIVFLLLGSSWLSLGWNVGAQDSHATSLWRLVVEVVSAPTLKAGRGVIQQMGTGRFFPFMFQIQYELNYDVSQPQFFAKVS